MHMSICIPAVYSQLSLLRLAVPIVWIAERRTAPGRRIHVSTRLGQVHERLDVRLQSDLPMWPVRFISGTITY